MQIQSVPLALEFEDNERGCKKITCKSFTKLTLNCRGGMYFLS